MMFIPSLGSHESVSLTETGLLHFYCVVDGDAEVEVWSNIGSEWRETPFAHFNGKVRQATFDLSHLPSGLHQFEYTYRLKQGAHITWLGDNGANGTLRVSKHTRQLPQSLSDIWEGFPSDAVSEIASINESTFAFKLLRFQLPQEQLHSISLGFLKDSGKALTFERARPTWLESRVLNSAYDLASDKDAQLLVAAAKDPSTLAVIFPLSIQASTTTLRGDLNPAEKQIWLRCLRNGQAEQAYCLVGYCKEWRLNDMMEQMFATVRSALYNQVSPPAPLEHSKKLTYCTWNGLGPHYSLQKVLDVLDSLENAEIENCFDSVLLDDGWQDVDESRRLKSFDVKDGWLDASYTKADTLAKRPDSGYGSSGYTTPDLSHSRSTSTDVSSGDMAADSLAQGIDLIKLRYPFIKRVGTWLSLAGYWDGISPDSNLAAKYNLQAVSTQSPNPVTWQLPVPQELNTFWQHYFTALKNAGVDFIKLDGQAHFDSLNGDHADQLKVEAYAIATNLATSVFGAANVIHCMAHSPNVIGGELAFGSPAKTLFRQFDDYFPNDPDSHPFLVAHAARLSVLLRSSSLVPDFDMFQSKHEYGSFHAALRVSSSAPINLTDKINEHDSTVIKSLSALSCGTDSVDILQSKSIPLFPSFAVFDDITQDNAGPACQLISQYPNVSSAVLSCWNCQKADSVTIITQRHVAEALAYFSLQEEEMLLYDLSTSAISLFTTNSSAIEESLFTAPAVSQTILPPGSTTQLCMVPYKQVDMSPSRTMHIACLGLSDKLNPLAALTSVTTHSSSYGALLSNKTDATELAERPKEFASASSAEFSFFSNFLSKIGRFFRYIFTFEWLTGGSVATLIDDERTPLLQHGADSANPVQKRGLRVKVTHAGQLTFVIARPEAPSDVNGYTLRLDDVPIPSEAIQVENVSEDHLLLTIDLYDSLRQLDDRDHDSSRTEWIIDLALR